LDGGHHPRDPAAKFRAAKTDQNLLQVVDLFCGAGGFTLAAHNSGCSTVFAVENDAHAATTFRKRFLGTDGGKTKLYEASILDLDAKALATKHFPDSGCDLVLGGPPCQGFSTHRIKGAGINDPRNKLILSYFEFVAALRPKAFLMENVPGMLWPRHASFLEKFQALAEQSGYEVFKPEMIDARDHGVPQRRKRVFVLGIRRDLDQSTLTWPPAVTHGDNEPGLQQWATCSAAFEPAPKSDPNNTHMNHGEELIKAFQATPINGGSRIDSGRILKCHENHDGHKDVYGRIDPKKPAPTMTTACVNPSKGRFVHPTEHHGITARQAARIQTFPDDFAFYGGLMAAGKQIGNAVPVLLGETLVSHISEWLRSLDKEPYEQVALTAQEVSG
jgi:DNA (cytosine-5)-methyltransferase 1